MGVGPSSFSAVVVISNRTEHPVQIDVMDRDGRSTAYQVPPNGLIPVVRFSPVTTRISIGEASTVQDLQLNRIYEIQTSGPEKARTIVVSPMQIGNIRPGVWLMPNGKKLPTSVTIPVAIFVDEEQPANRSVWEPRLKAQVAEASRFLEWFCRVRFEVVNTGTWVSDNARNTPDGILEDFRRKTTSQEAKLLIGFSSQLAVPADGRFHALAQLLDSHIVLPDVQGTFSAQTQLMSLIHALGHFLGAVDTTQDGSVMNPNYAGTGGEGRQRDYFDPLNVLIMNIVAEDLMFRGVGQIDQLSTGTKDYLSSLYRFLGQRGRRRDIQFLLESLEKPVTPTERFVVLWQDGQQTSAPEISNWGDPESQPDVMGHLVFDANAPARWILDTTLSREEGRIQTWIDLWAGDRLPGRVERANPAGVFEKDQLPAHLEVTPYIRADWPDGPSRTVIRVLTSQVKRIVWKQVVSELQPGHAFLRDGRSVAYRLVQWNPNGVRLLTSDGIQTITFAELAELHLPPTDPWEEIIQQRAGLTPEGAGTIIQIETVDGLIATSSRERFLVRSRGDKAVPDNWYHLIQPVWSLDGLWIPHRSVVWRRFFASHEVPLSVISPSSYRETSTIGGRWGYRVNRNLKGDIMSSGQQVSGWGFGAPSGSELVFPLSPLVSAFQTKIGLDKAAGDGGCIRASVIVSQMSEHPLYQSPLIVGSGPLLDTGKLQLKTESEPGRLIFRVDEAHEDRPPAADPWNVRDLANWSEPLLMLDQQAFANAISQQRSRLVWAWQGWQTKREHEPVRITHNLDQTSQNYPSFRWIHAFDSEFAIEQTLTIPANARALAVLVCRPRGIPEYRAEVFADGQLLTSGVVPEWHGGNLPPPIEADLSKFVNQRIQLRVVLRSDNPTRDLKAEWHSIQVLRNPANDS